ncbi:hypothetical protein JTB14_034592 [Gonioctena quinquepunctata]|nr:hypothetical protein JTB14_034592 [Gonioctena quinquepunctata]
MNKANLQNNISLSTDKGEIVSDGETIANLFNSFFKQVPYDVIHNIPNTEILKNCGFYENNIMPSKCRKYDESLIEKALREMKTNGSSYRKVAEKYGIPKSTIELKKKHPGYKSTFGPSPVLTPGEEDNLVQWILEMAKKGFPCKKEDILQSVQKFVLAVPRDYPFKHNRPGDGWFKVNIYKDEPYEYDTEQTAKNIEGVAKEVHGIGTRKKKVMEINAEESDRENEKTYVDEDTDILLNMYQEETCSYNYKGNPTLSWGQKCLSNNCMLGVQ